MIVAMSPKLRRNGEEGRAAKIPEFWPLALFSSASACQHRTSPAAKIPPNFGRSPIVAHTQGVSVWCKQRSVTHFPCRVRSAVSVCGTQRNAIHFRTSRHEQRNMAARVDDFGVRLLTPDDEAEMLSSQHHLRGTQRRVMTNQAGRVSDAQSSRDC